MIQLKSGLRPRIKKTSTTHETPQANRLLSRKEVAARWGTSTETVKRRAREGLLPSLRFNQRLVRYRLSDVEKAERDAIGPFEASPFHIASSETDGGVA